VYTVEKISITNGKVENLQVQLEFVIKKIALNSISKKVARMKIFITSGGTKVPIDPVRDITNMSHGTFGSKLATEALNQGHEVFYFTSKDGRTPFKHTTDFFNDCEKPLFEQYLDKEDWANGVLDLYQEAHYRNYEDYATGLQSNLIQYRPDIIILAAAVSDYVVDASEEKVRSSENLTLHMKKAKKLIGQVKNWCPSAYLVGFKLLVGVTNEELLTAARTSIGENGCDLVVANEFNKLRSGRHEIILVSPVDDPKIVIGNMAAEVIKYATNGWRG